MSDKRHYRCLGCRRTFGLELLRSSPPHGNDVLERCPFPGCGGQIDVRWVVGDSPPPDAAETRPCGCDGPKVVVPQPPFGFPFCPTKNSDVSIVTVCVGAEAEGLLSITGPYMEAYARRLGADFHVSTWPGHPDWPMSAKFGVAGFCFTYDRVVYVDADVLLRPGCVDLLDACRPNEVGFCDELTWHRTQPQHGREKGYHRFREEMGFPEIILPWYFNAGVMVLPKWAACWLLPPTAPMPATHCSEQDWYNARFMSVALAEKPRPGFGGRSYRLLDRRCNWQSWTDYGFRAAPPDAVLHWSGAGGERKTRAEQIRQWAERFPLAADHHQEVA